MAGIARIPRVGPPGRLARLIAWAATLRERDAGREEDLVRRAAAGDHDAFERLVVPRARRLLATARKILRDPDAAEDATQQALVDAWRTLPRLRDPGRFDAWLARLHVNACYAEARARTRRARRVAVAERTPAVDDGSDARAMRMLLEEAFQALSPEHRTVLVLRHFDDLPLADVAAATGVPPGTARSRLHYALRALRAAIEAAERPAPMLEELDR